MRFEFLCHESMDAFIYFCQSYCNSHCWWGKLKKCLSITCQNPNQSISIMAINNLSWVKSGKASIGTPCLMAATIALQSLLSMIITAEWYYPNYFIKHKAALGFYVCWASLKECFWVVKYINVFCNNAEELERTFKYNFLLNNLLFSGLYILSCM